MPSVLGRLRLRGLEWWYRCLLRQAVGAQRQGRPEEQARWLARADGLRRRIEALRQS